MTPDCFCDVCGMGPPSNEDPPDISSDALGYGNVYAINGVLHGERCPSITNHARPIIGNFGVEMTPPMWDPKTSDGDIFVQRDWTAPSGYKATNPYVVDGKIRVRMANPSACMPMLVHFFIDGGVVNFRYYEEGDHYNAGWHFEFLDDDGVTLISENRSKGVGATSNRPQDKYRLTGQQNWQRFSIPGGESRTMTLQPHLSRDYEEAKGPCVFAWTSMELSAIGHVMVTEGAI